MIKIYDNYPLLSHNTFGIEATAKQFVEFETEEELLSFLGDGYGSRSLVIGGGSNLLFVKDFDGTVFHSSIKGVEVLDENETDVVLRVGSGVNWDDFVAYTVEKGWHGIENLSLIPGEVGASAVQNVGAYGVEAGELIENVETVAIATATQHSFAKDECRFAYRHSIFKAEEKDRHIITYVTYRLKKKAAFRLSYGNLNEKVAMLGETTLANVRAAVCDIRRAKLPCPSEIGSAGSFFMNPVVDPLTAAQLREKYPQMPQYPLENGNVKLSAGWLIDRCGWKERPHKNVGVYKHQALVVINRGGAKGSEVLAFAAEVVASVKERFGVLLNMEVNVIE